jgi:hypothetical protein
VGSKLILIEIKHIFPIFNAQIFLGLGNQALSFCLLSDELVND